jgi:hypothetical protein
MKKLNKFTKKRVQQLLTVEELSKKVLAGALRRYHEEHLRLLKNQISESIKASRKADGDLSKKIAEFQFKHSKKINAALLSSPKFLPRFIDQNLSGEPGDPSGGGPGDPFGGGPGDPFGDWRGNPKDNPRWDEFVTTVKVLGNYFEISPPFDFDPLALVRPIIISYPTTLNVSDNYYTITGTRFGASPGSIYITITDTGLRINLAVIQWSDTAITFLIPTSVSGVPFHSEGQLTVQNSDGYNASVRVIVEPLTTLYFYVDSFSESGQEYRAIPPGPDWWYTYEKEISLTSPTLPQEYELFQNSNLPAAGLNFYIASYNSLPGGIESQASVSLLAGPYESGNCLQVNVKVTDDWYWDYTVSACFYIIAPHGYSAQGWTRQGS